MENSAAEPFLEHLEGEKQLNLQRGGAFRLEVMSLNALLCGVGIL